MPASDLYNGSFEIRRQTKIQAPGGAWDESGFNTVGTYAGRMRPVRATELQFADQERADMTHVLYVNAGVDLMRGDIVVNADKLLTAEVLAIREPSFAGEHWEVDCRAFQFERAGWQ